MGRARDREKRGQEGSVSGRNWGSMWRFSEGFTDGGRERVSETVQVE